MVDFTRIKVNDLDNVLDLIYAIRLSITAEHEAIQLYEQIANMSSVDNVKTIFQDIANEEKVHVGELEALLTNLIPEELTFYGKGREEFYNKITKPESVVEPIPELSNVTETVQETSQQVQEISNETSKIEENNVEELKVEEPKIEIEEQKIVDALDKEKRLSELKTKILNPDLSVDEMMSITEEIQLLSS